MQGFLIGGYGVPNDILLDENYRRYLGIAFNTIYDQVKNKPAVIVFAGGKTDIRKPYKKSEAGEMARLFKEWARRPSCQKATGDWSLMMEARSLSTVENLLYTAKQWQAKHLAIKRLTIFCEATRASRVRALAKQVFAKTTIVVVPVEFDLSPNRYLDPTFIAEKERKTLSIERWALKDAKNLKEYRGALEERIAYFRRVGPKGHVEAIKKWWETKLDELYAK